MLGASLSAFDRSCANEVNLASSDCFAEIVKARPAISALGATDACIGELRDDLPTMALRCRDQVTALVFNRLIYRASSEIDCSALHSITCTIIDRLLNRRSRCQGALIALAISLDVAVTFSVQRPSVITVG